MKKKDINSAYEENPVEDSLRRNPPGKRKKEKRRNRKRKALLSPEKSRIRSL